MFDPDATEEGENHEIVESDFEWGGGLDDRLDLERLRATADGGREFDSRTAAEFTEIAKKAAPLAGKAIAQYVGLKDDAEKKFVDAYVAESAEAQKRLEDAGKENAGDMQAMMDVFRTNGEKMQEMLNKNLTPEQVQKAQKVGGPFNIVNWEIINLLRDKVEPEKIEKALPVLTKHTEATQELTAKMRDGSLTREEIGAKITELREQTAKDLAPAIGEEAANKWKEIRGFGPGMRGGAPSAPQP
jgi:PIN domain nuclease of toxin-antitoxin system